SLQYQATGTFTDGTTRDLTSSVTWSADVGATVSNTPGSKGLATAAGPGATRVRAAFGGVTGDAGLTVTAATLASIEVTPASTAVPLGLSQPYAATGVFTDGSTQDLSAQVSWSTLSGTGTATITPGGLATGTAAGQL